MQTERGNPEGARRQLHKGLHKLAAYLPFCEGLDTERLHRETLVALESWRHSSVDFSIATLDLRLT
jgi:hypothetical protein